MKMEIRYYFRNSLNSTSQFIEECSVAAHEVSEIDIKAYLECFEKLGCKRRENRNSFWYEFVEDARHSTEYIFYK